MPRAMNPGKRKFVRGQQKRTSDREPIKYLGLLTREGVRVAHFEFEAESTKYNFLTFQECKTRYTKRKRQNLPIGETKKALDEFKSEE